MYKYKKKITVTLILEIVKLQKQFPMLYKK